MSDEITAFSLARSGLQEIVDAISPKRADDLGAIRKRAVATLEAVDAKRGLRNDPKTICKLLRAMAGGTDAQANRHDTILIAAAEMIEAFERRMGL